MELTTREQAIKKVVLDEFRHPGYAEKKHLIEKVDREWLEKEIHKLESKGRLLPWILVIGGTLVSVTWGIVPHYG